MLTSVRSLILCPCWMVIVARSTDLLLSRTDVPLKSWSLKPWISCRLSLFSRIKIRRLRISRSKSTRIFFNLLLENSFRIESSSSSGHKVLCLPSHTSSVNVSSNVSIRVLMQSFIAPRVDCAQKYRRVKVNLSFSNRRLSRRSPLKRNVRPGVTSFVILW